MTAKSAYEQFEKRGSKNGYCLPLSIDSILKVSTLPDDYYDMCYEASLDPNSSYNKIAGTILKNFFGIEPQLDAGLPAVGKFTAFGGSPQLYMPDAPYEYPEDEGLQKVGVTIKQLRLMDLLEKASENSCNVIFTKKQENGEHVGSLDLIDVGQPDSAALYMVRNKGIIQGDTIYRSYDFAGLMHRAPLTTEFTPLPEVTRPYFPTGESSWELAVFPPDPKI